MNCAIPAHVDAGSGPADVLNGEAFAFSSHWRTFWRARAKYAAPLAVFLISVGVGSLSSTWLGEGYASLIFVLGITLIGSMSGLAIAVASAVAGAVAFNWFVSAPTYAFTYNRPIDFAPPFAFAFCAVISGVMAGRLKDRTQRVEATSERLVSLLEASRDLQRASQPLEIYATLETSVLARLGIHLGLYEIAGDALLPIGESLADPAWLQLGQRIHAAGCDRLRHNSLSGYRLCGSAGAVGVLITDAADNSELDDRFMLTLVGILGMALERAQLTNRVAEVQAAARTEELKTALLSSVSHDMRTPLTSISTSAASLLAFGDQFDETTSRQLLGGIVEECDRLNHLTANLLEMTRLQCAPDQLRRSVLPVSEMIRSAVARLDTQPSADGARRPGRLRFKAPHQPILIEADTALFELALTNIIQNALQYSPPDSPVSVRCEVLGEHCAISVTDNGRGIPPDQQERVFERFYRVRSDHRSPKGTGLGLAIAKGFVEASQGTIGIQSPVQGGKGTTITITLPLADRQLLAS